MFTNRHRFGFGTLSRGNFGHSARRPKALDQGAAVHLAAWWSDCLGTYFYDSRCRVSTTASAGPRIFPPQAALAFSSQANPLLLWY